MPTCAYCDAPALYRDRDSGAYLCAAHSRLEVIGPRGEVPWPPLTFRPAVSADGSQIAQMSEYFWGETEVESFGRCYEVQHLPAYVACDGDEIVAVASFARETDAFNLVMLVVLPRWQGRGVAHWLMAEVIDTARTEGVRRLLVATSNDDLPALALYQRAGFVITDIAVGRLVEHHGGVERGFSGIPVRDEVRMELGV